MARSAQSRAPRKRRKPSVAKAGTALALIDIPMSEAQVDAKPMLSWGGKRNSRDRLSYALPLAKAQAIIGAAYQAHAIGLPFNRHLSVHWELLGLTDADAAEATGRLVKLAKDWLRTKGQQFACAWVREYEGKDGRKGSHLHLLCHCPDGLPIGRMWLRWLRKITGRPYRFGGVHTTRIGGTLNCYRSNPAKYAANLDVVLAYVVKGVSPADAVALGLPHQQNGGAIIGKRAGWSQNIGAKSRVLFRETIAPLAVSDRTFQIT